MTQYQLKRGIYLDRVEGQYKSVMIIKPEPKTSNLKSITTNLYTGKLSIFDERNVRANKYCEHVVLDPNTKKILSVEDIEILSSYLKDNSFSILHDLTNTLLSKGKRNPYRDLIFMFEG